MKDIRQDLMMDKNGNRKKILILGAGNAQIDLIRYCADQGMEVYGCSYSDRDPGIRFLDHFARINITDAQSVTEYARDNQVDFVYSVGSDIAMPTVSIVSERLGLSHFVSSECALICCNKQKMREALKESRYYIPYKTCRTIEETEDWDIWPVTVKPVDSQGQRGVSVASDREQLKSAFERAQFFSRSGPVILEEFVKGQEVSVNAFLREGEITFSVITDREAFPQFPGGIIHRHYIPSAFCGTIVQDRIMDLVKDITRRLKISEGPVYFQIMIREGQPYLIEITPRLDGCHMWRLIRMYCGADLLDMSMRALCHEQADEGASTRREAFAEDTGSELMTEFFSMKPGSVFDTSLFEALPALYREFYYADGEIVKPINGYMEKCGFRITGQEYRD